MTRWLEPWRPLIAMLMFALAHTSCGETPTSPTRPPTQPPPTQSLPLSISCPTAVSASSTNGSGVVVNYSAPTTAGGPSGATPTISCTPASGSLFPVGKTEVRCTATAATQTAACSFEVTVTPPTPTLTRTKFLAFGDSLTAGVVAQPALSRWREGPPYFAYTLIPTASYPTKLLSLLRDRYTAQSAQLQLANAGIAGEWAEDGAKRLPGAISDVRPEVVLLLEGINELTALGQPGVQRAARAIDTMAREARNRGARLFLATLPPTRPVSTAPDLSLVQALNAQIRTSARGENAVVVDLFGVLAGNLTRYIGADGIHPTEAGYEKIAETFMNAIRANLEAGPSQPTHEDP